MAGHELQHEWEGRSAQEAELPDNPYVIGGALMILALAALVLLSPLPI